MTDVRASGGAGGVPPTGTAGARATKLAAVGVRKAFDVSGGGSFTALAEVDLEVGAGEFVSLIGPSGCGKSTLLEILAGLQMPTEGSVALDGRTVTGPGPDRAVVFQNYALFPWRTVIQNVTFGPEIAGVDRAERLDRARRLLGLVGLSGFADHFVWQISGGMRQRVGLARALACEPEVLLMDEPFGALDALTRDLLQDQLLEIQRETRKSVVFVTHSVDEAIYLSDRIVVMGTGPGRVVREISVGLDRDGGREAMRSTPRYGAIHREVWALLEQELAKAAAGPGGGA